jgi:hypothetical protein
MTCFRQTTAWQASRRGKKSKTFVFKIAERVWRSVYTMTKSPMPKVEGMTCLHLTTAWPARLRAAPPSPMLRREKTGAEGA